MYVFPPVHLDKVCTEILRYLLVGVWPVPIRRDAAFAWSNIYISIRRAFGAYMN